VAQLRVKRSEKKNKNGGDAQYIAGWVRVRVCMCVAGGRLGWGKVGWLVGAMRGRGCGPGGVVVGKWEHRMPGNRKTEDF